MLGYIFLFIFSVFISSVSQLLLKISAGGKYTSLIKEYLNVKVISAYCIFFVATILTLIAYKRVPLSMGPVIESLGYIFVSILGYIFLKERIGKKSL